MRDLSGWERIRKCGMNEEITTTTFIVMMRRLSNSKDKPCFYKLNYAELPDELFHVLIPVEKWLDRSETAGLAGFAKNSLNQLFPLDSDVEFECIVGISLYMVGSVFSLRFRG